MMANAMRIRNENSSVDVRIQDTVALEAQLFDKGITFHKEEKHSDILNSETLLQKYYFKKEDYQKVDQIMIDLNLVTIHTKSTNQIAFIKPILIGMLIVAFFVILMILTY